MPTFVSMWLCNKCNQPHANETLAQSCEAVPIASKAQLPPGLIFELEGAICLMTGDFDTGIDVHCFRPHAWRFDKGRSGDPYYVKMVNTRCDVVPAVFGLFCLPESLELRETKMAIEFATRRGVRPCYYDTGELVYID